MLVDDVGTDGRVYRDGNALLGGAHEERRLRRGEARPSLQVVGQGFPHPLAALCAGGYGRVHLATGFLRHAEGTVGEAGRHVLARSAVRGELEVVNRGAAIQRQVCDHAASRELAQQGSKTDLDDVAAEHDDHAVVPGGARQVVRHVTQISCRQDVGQRLPERGEAPVGAGWVGEERSVDLVVALRDGDRLEPRQVRLAVVGHGCSGRGSEYSLSLSVTWPNEKLDCSAIMTRRLSSESHIRASAFSAKMPPPFGMRGRTTIVFHFRPAAPTRSRLSTSTITGLRSGRK